MMNLNLRQLCPSNWYLRYKKLDKLSKIIYQRQASLAT